MKHTSIKIITQISIFLVAIIGLFIIQFKSGTTFSLNLGPVSVAGRYDIVDGKSVPLLPIQILANGIGFFVSERDAIIAENEEGNENLKIVSYANTEKTFKIFCTKDVSINFTYDKFGDIEVLNISAKIPESIEAVSIPWKITANAKFEIKNTKSLISFNKKNFQFEGDFGFNEMGIIDSKVEQPRLRLAKETEAFANYLSYIEASEFSVEGVSSMVGSSEEEYKAAKEAFANTALTVMSEQITRKNYNEQILVSYIAEMARQNMYLSALTKAPASLLSKNARTALSLTFYGNIIEMYDKVLQEENIQRNNLSKLITEASFSIFETENLIAYLVDRNSEILITDIKKLLSENDISNINLAQSIGIVECFLDYAEYFPNNENFFEKNLETCFRKIKGSLFVIGDALYSAQDDGEKRFIDNLLSLRLSKLLLRVQNNEWKPVGYKLYTSICGLLGADASLARIFNVTGEDEQLGLVIDDKEILSAAKLYPFMIENSWYPSAISLYKAGHGTWAYASAKSFKIVETRPKYLHIAVEGVRDSSEYIVLRNIQRLKNIIIYGLDYRSDRRFETYNSSGYVYNEATSTLYLKIKHKKDIEEIILEMN